jgi:pimeloyl-ACP methyl ester carboxylesterase
VRPVVFLPGWGSVPEAFRDFFRAVDRRVEYYYIETREKGSSRLDRRTARMDMDSCAGDVRRVLDAMGLTDGRDFVLLGTCWGATIAAHGLAEGILTAPTAVFFDPMHKLWFPDWLLRYAVPLMPICFVHLIKPLAKRIALHGMESPTQRQRTELFIDSAVLWKWKRTALQVRDTDLYSSAGRIREDVFVLTGVSDKIHDQSHYPRLTALMPRGRFFYLPVRESQREAVMGFAAFEFARVSADRSPPASILRFERKLQK